MLQMFVLLRLLLFATTISIKNYLEMRIFYAKKRLSKIIKANVLSLVANEWEETKEQETSKV